jgi:hypothetical protein
MSSLFAFPFSRRSSSSCDEEIGADSASITGVGSQYESIKARRERGWGKGRERERGQDFERTQKLKSLAGTTEIFSLWLFGCGLLTKKFIKWRAERPTMVAFHKASIKLNATMAPFEKKYNEFLFFSFFPFMNKSLFFFFFIFQGTC